MGTVDKALNLLNYFTLSHPQWGLSDLARKSQLDKATTLRLLRSLEQHRMIEQDAGSKLFRLGTAFLNLARVREQSFPLTSIIKKWLEQLANETGETAHASLASDTGMATICIAEPHRSTRVNVDPSELLPFHATASGFAYLAFIPQIKSNKIITNSNLQAYTEHTILDPNEVSGLIAKTKLSGYSTGDQSFEIETVGLAVPLFDNTGNAQGALAVASPTMRMTPDLKTLIIDRLMKTTLNVAAEMGGLIPPNFRQIASDHSSHAAPTSHRGTTQ